MIVCNTVDKLQGGVAAMGKVFGLAVVMIVVVELGQPEAVAWNGRKLNIR